MSDSPLICTVIDGKAFVPMAEHNELLQREKRLFDTLDQIAILLNKLAAEERRIAAEREKQEG